MSTLPPSVKKPRGRPKTAPKTKLQVFITTETMHRIDTLRREEGNFEPVGVYVERLLRQALREEMARAC